MVTMVLARVNRVTMVLAGRTRVTDMVLARVARVIMVLAERTRVAMVMARASRMIARRSTQLCSCPSPKSSYGRKHHGRKHLQWSVSPSALNLRKLNFWKT